MDINYVKSRADYVVSSSVKVVFICDQKVCVSCHTILHYVRHWMVKIYWWHWLKLHWLLVCAFTVSDYMDLSVCFPTVLFAWTQGSVCYCEVSQRENVCTCACVCVWLNISHPINCNGNIRVSCIIHQITCCFLFVCWHSSAETMRGFTQCWVRRMHVVDRCNIAVQPLILSTPVCTSSPQLQMQSVTSHSGSCILTSGILVMELVISWKDEDYYLSWK